MTVPAATASAFERPSVKPTGSMTHPLRDPKTQGARRKLKQGAPIDPEDLSRRLNLHLAEQKERAEQQRRNRQLKAAAVLGADISQFQPHYRHVPLVAASAFERTMTPDVMHNSPKIAQPAIRAHLESLKIENSPAIGSQNTLLRQTQARDRETLDRQMLASRNQFQWSQDLENADEADMDRDLFKPPQRTFAEFAYLKGRTSNAGPRPMSTGDVLLWENGATIGSPQAKAKPLQVRNVVNDRNDWAQRDDERKEKQSPLIRKRESNWILSGIKSRKQDRSTENISPPDTNNLPKMKAGFLARFKRNPS